MQYVDVQTVEEYNMIVSTSKRNQSTISIPY